MKIDLDQPAPVVAFSNHSFRDFPDLMERFKILLYERNIGYHTVFGTRDYFCRDFMPVPVSSRLAVQFKFEPFYLRGEQAVYRTRLGDLYRKNRFLKEMTVLRSDLVLDGGNVILNLDLAILTDRVFDDNPHPDPSVIRRQLEVILNRPVLIVPQYPGEPTGHIDGMVRFVDPRRVVTYNLDDTEPGWTEHFRETLSGAGLEVVSLPYVSVENEHNWAYLNFLEVGDLIVIPSFARKSDKTIIPFLKELFSGRDIEVLDGREPFSHGGVFNCMSWVSEESAVPLPYPTPTNV